MTETLCRMCHREKNMISQPDNYTCSILCQKLRRGEITKSEWYVLYSSDLDGFTLPQYESCNRHCSWAGSWGATGILPPGHCKIKHREGAQICHDGLPFPVWTGNNQWVVLNGDWVQVDVSQ